MLSKLISLHDRILSKLLLGDLWSRQRLEVRGHLLSVSLGPLAWLIGDAPLLQPGLEVAVLGEEVGGQVEEVLVLRPAREVRADEGRLAPLQGTDQYSARN